MGNNREKELSRVTVWGAISNVALTAVKFVAGFAGHSSAMMADALHSLSDLVSDVVVLVMVKLSSKGHDEGHDYGHGKFETLATVGVAVLLLVAGGELMAGGVEEIRQVIDGEDIATPGRIALWAALLSVAVKEALYQWTALVGRRNSSPAVITNAWHHRTDALSSVASAAGIGCAILLGGKWAVLDPVMGCIISVIIIVIAIKMAIPALSELTDASLSGEIEKGIAEAIMSVGGVQGVHAMKTRKNGPDIIVEAHVVVAGDMTVSVAHDIMDEAEKRVRERFGAETQISLHVEPI